MAHRERPGTVPGYDFSLRGIHTAEADEVPRESGRYAVLHVLHLAEHEGRAHRVLHGADDRRVARFPPAEPFCEYAGHSACVPAARGASGVRGAAAGRGDPRGELWDLQRIRAVRS